MSQRISQNLCSKFSIIKNGKINFAFDPAEKPDTLEPQPTHKKEEDDGIALLSLQIMSKFLI